MTHPHPLRALLRSSDGIGPLLSLAWVKPSPNDPSGDLYLLDASRPPVPIAVSGPDIDTVLPSARQILNRPADGYLPTNTALILISESEWDAIKRDWETELARRRAAEEAARREEEARKAEREARRRSMTVTVLKRRTVPGSDGPDHEAVVEITDPTTNEKGRFVCRDLFDVGYVINPDYAVQPGSEPGGIAVRHRNGRLWWQRYDADRGWYYVRALTPFEERAVRYLTEFPPVNYVGPRL